jgi:hypothetical protein
MTALRHLGAILTPITVQDQRPRFVMEWSNASGENYSYCPVFGCISLR